MDRTQVSRILSVAAWILMATGAGLLIHHYTADPVAPESPQDPGAPAPSREAVAGGSPLPHGVGTPAGPPSEGANSPRPAGQARLTRVGEVEGANALPTEQPLPPRSAWPTTAEGIQGAVREATPELKLCYQSWLKVQPDLAGRMVVAFTIGPDPEDPGLARVTQVGVQESTVNNAFFSGCALDAMENLVFDPPAGGTVTVSYPFVFSTE